MKSKEAVKLFAEDDTAFDAYHEGYRQQVEKWPINPLDRIIKAVKKMPKEFVIGDFGCGDGRLSKSVPHKVFSVDLVSNRDDIIACDMAKTPLKSNSLDCAVYCLSLMGTNFNDYLLEANRLLKIGGFLQIAEISSRYDNVNDFVKKLELCGFKLLNKEAEDKKVFFFFKFKKTANVDKTCKLPEYSLKPCAYKKR
ncbi:RRP8 family protein [Megaselia abdita]